MLKKTLAALLALTMLCGCAAESAESNTESLKEPVEEEMLGGESVEQEMRGPLEQFTVIDLDGNAVTEEVFADYDMTVVNIWGTFCGPCINEMPVLGKLAEEYAEKNVQFIGLVGDAINFAGDEDETIIAEAKEIVAQTEANYLHLVPIGNLAAYLMPQISAYPTTIFVDSKGAQVGYAFAGALSEEQWVSIIDETLALVEE